MANNFQVLQSKLNRLKYAISALAIVLVPLFAPVEASFADASTCTAPTGPNLQHPNGPDAGLYTYNCDNGLWQSSHYTFDPTTGKYTPTDPTTYTYDSNSGQYIYNVWLYDTSTNTYVNTPETTANPPAGATIVGGPTTTSDPSNTPDTTTGDTPGDSSTDTSGSNTNTNVNGSNTNTGNINNQVSQVATTGDASVDNNISAGSATSGNAIDEANIINLLQSTSNALGGNVMTFTANIDGNVSGDLLLDPTVVANIQPSDTSANSIQLNNSNNDTMNNEIDLSAVSGNANVSSNVNAGDATSGAATTIANVVNIIDSAVTSGKSFLGVININGNLNGNILMPADFVNQLEAANVPTVNVVAGPSVNTDVTENNSNNQVINNNISTNAQSGSADVSGNINSGSATTGAASTVITAFNLTNSQIVGSNDLLVFVNVVGGSWVGLIVNAPAGTTAAEFGENLSSTNLDANIDNSNTDTINNNINLTSKSGNASVDNNINAGNARSGNATAGVNLLNVEDSTISLSNWFGILFINVFGTWNGNFGISSTPSPTTLGGGASLPGAFTPSHKAVSFIPSNSGASYDYSGTNNNTQPSNTSGNSATNDNNSILAAARNVSKAPHSIVSTPSHVSLPIIISGCGILAVYLLAERFYAVRQARPKAS